MLQKSFRKPVETIAAHTKPNQFSLLLLVTPIEAGICIGYKPQTTLNRLHLGTFPIQTVDQDGRRMVRVADIYKYADNLPTEEPKKKRGAPTKAERHAKARKLQLGVTK